MSGARTLRVGLIPALALAAALAAPADARAQAAGQWKDEQHVYAKICGNCHDTGIGPVIKGRGLPPEYYVYTVRHGLRAMPPFRQTDIDDPMLQRLAESLSHSRVAASQEVGK